MFILPVQNRFPPPVGRPHPALIPHLSGRAAAAAAAARARAPPKRAPLFARSVSLGWAERAGRPLSAAPSPAAAAAVAAAYLAVRFISQGRASISIFTVARGAVGAGCRHGRGKGGEGEGDGGGGARRITARGCQGPAE